MTIPIVEDWKAIHDRMQQIKAERSTSRQCPRCKGTGWMPDLYGYRSSSYRLCDVCDNPERLPRPSRL
jgi:hypothetical protein